MITTERLTIRPLTNSDAPFIFELLNQQDFIDNIGDRGVNSIDDAVAYIENGPQKMQQEYGFSLMAVGLKSGELIGLCGLLKRDYLAHPDIGYALLPNYYQKGYAFEAAKAVLTYFTSISNILAITSNSNTASQNLLRKLGFNEIEAIEMPDGEKPTTFSWERI